SGTVEYNPDTNTLTLEDATIEVGDDKNCIWVPEGQEDFTIVVEGTCRLSSTTWSPLNIWGNTTISGDGELYLESKEGRINLDQGATLIIDRCRVDAKGESGISGFNESSDAKLVIKNATVTAEGTEGSITNLASLTLEGCEITEPAGATFNESKHAVCDADGNVIKSKIVIRPTVKVIEYIKIAGVQVTSENCDDLSVIDGVSGTVEYNPDTKTLTLEDARIEVGDDRSGIESSVENLTIVVRGTCNLSTAKAAISLRENTTITGGGTLSTASSTDCAIYLQFSLSLTIDGCRVEAKGEYGIAGYNGENGEHLTIKNATVTAEGSKGSICDLASLTLEGCKITQPVGAAFNESKHAVCDADGNIIKSKIDIKPSDPDAIERISLEEPAYRGIYNLLGIKLNIPFEQLPSGVYIVDGVKVFKK
ncbi:peptidase, partial [Porphyromonas circumdentaria]